MNFGSQEFAASIDGMPASRNSITSRSGSVPNMRSTPRFVRKVFNTEEEGRTTENHGAECRLRFARSALNPYSVAPSSSLLPPC
jgi:hypothetical protein